MRPAAVSETSPGACVGGGGYLTRACSSGSSQRGLLCPVATGSLSVALASHPPQRRAALFTLWRERKVGRPTVGVGSP